MLTFVVKATYRIENSPEIEMAENQAPINMGGQYYGEPGSSSLKYDSDVAFTKVATDIVLIGHAHAPNNTTTQLDVFLRAGPLSKIVRVFGDRFWKKNFGSWSITAPQPFKKTPLMYELAFGGLDHTDDNALNHSYEARNPVGTGYISTKNGKLQGGTKLPNIEDPKFLISLKVQRINHRRQGLDLLLPIGNRELSFLEPMTKTGPETGCPFCQKILIESFSMPLTPA